MGIISNTNSLHLDPRYIRIIWTCYLYGYGIIIR